MTGQEYFKADLRALFRSKAQYDQYTVPVQYGFIDHERENGIDYYDLFSSDRSQMLCCQGDTCFVENEMNGDFFICNVDDEEASTHFVLTADELELVFSEYIE